MRKTTMNRRAFTIALEQSLNRLTCILRDAEARQRAGDFDGARAAVRCAHGLQLQIVMALKTRFRVGWG